MKKSFEIKKSICLALECIVIIYSAITIIIQLYMLSNVFESDVCNIMQSNFYGAVLLVNIMVIFSLSLVNTNIFILEKVRPFFCGMIIFGVFLSGELPFNLFLILMVSYFLCSFSDEKYKCELLTKTLFLGSLYLEVFGIFVKYSEVFILPKWVEKICFSSIPDIILAGTMILVIIFYYFNKNEKLESGKDNNKRDAYCWLLKDGKIYKLIGNLLTICTITFSLLVSVVLVTVDARKENNLDGVYVIRHLENQELVLTLLEKENGYEVVFAEDVGSNNQKLCLKEAEDGTYSLIFAGTTCSLEIKNLGSQFKFCVIEDPTQYQHRWLKIGSEERNNTYSLMSQYGFLLSYTRQKDEAGVCRLTFDIYSDCCNKFIIEKTTFNEFYTKIESKYYEDLSITPMLETYIAEFEEWSYLLFAIITVVIVFIFSSRKVIGVECSLLNIALLIFLLGYGAIIVSIYNIFAFIVQYYCKKILKEREGYGN